MQAIQTKYLGPTNNRGGRLKATCDAGALTVEWNHALNPTDNHRAVARRLILQLGWHGTWVQGSLPGGGDVFVCRQRREADWAGNHEGFDVWAGMSPDHA